ncbi:MAG: hypothetical protein V2I33_24305 [Kangiellaceae bacterium]|jgi:hypothetical protein|nr:hypothetical protein [Kangiellaceae bacterium]
MSIGIGKQKLMTGPELITPSKRLATGTPSVNQVIDIVNSTFEQNLNRLNTMFRKLDRGTLESVLRNCENNLEKTIEILSSG